ncbi:MAG TPA: translocation/assembly module TamB domain-containing protein [Polyangiales bacterium]|nr:translocation/assembly module TamB domain-containing protein [Polyangiales bacterium]
MSDGRKKRMSFKRWLALFCALVVLLPVTLAALARMPFMREYARQQAVKAIRGELGLSGVIEDIDIETRTLTFVARQITLDHPQHGRFVEAELLRIRPSWWALLRGQIDLHNISIDRASVWLEIRDGKLINGPEVKASPSAAPLSLDLPFNKIWIKHSRLFVHAQGQGSAELADIDIFLDSSKRDVLAAEVHSPHGLVKHKLGEDQVEDLQLTARLTKESVQVELLHVRGRDLSVALRRARVHLPAAGAPPTDYQGELELGLDLAQLARWPLPVKLPPLSGKLGVLAHVRNGGADGLNVDGHLNMAHVYLDQYGFGDDLNLDFGLKDNVLSFNGASALIRKGGRVELTGTLELTPTLPLRLRTRVVDLEFAKLMEQLGVTPNAIVDWRLGGGFELSGTLDPLLLQGPLRMPTTDFRVLRGPWHQQPKNVIAVASANLAGTVVVKPQGIYFLDTDLGLRRSKLHVDEVLLGFDNQFRVRAVGEVVDLRDATPLVDFPIAGTGQFDVKVDGTFQEPKVGGHVRFDGFSFGSFPFGDVESDYVLERNVQAVRFPEMIAKKGKSRYRALDFVLDFNDRRLSVDAALSFDHFAMQDFYHIFHYENDERFTPYQATVTGAAQLRYTVDFPGDLPNGTLHADAELALDEAEISGFHFTGGEAIGSWHWRDHKQGYRAGQLEIERFSLKKGDGTLSISGRMGYGGKLDMVVVSDKIALRDMEGLGDRVAGIGGAFATTGTIKGDASLPRVEMELAASSLSFNGELLGDSRGYVLLTSKNDPFIKEALSWVPGEMPKKAVCPNARLGLAHAHWPEDPPMHTAEGLMPALDVPMAIIVCGSALGGRLEYDLAFGRTKSYPVRGELRMRALPLSKLVPRGSLAADSGVLTGNVRFTDGAMFEPSLLAGSLHLDKLTLGQAGVTLENAGPIDVQFGDGRFDLAQAAFIGQSTEVTLSGGGSVLTGLGLNLSGSVDLGILSTFSSRVSMASGSVQFDVKVSGDANNPGIFGQASAEGASLRLKDVPYPVDDIDAQVTFSAERVLIESITARVLSGTLNLQGVAALQGRDLGSYRLELIAERMFASPREGVEVLFGGKGELSWKQGDRLPKLRGALRLGRTHYTRPISMGTTLQDLTKKGRVDVATYDPELDHVALDVRIQQSEPMRIDNNLIEAEIAIDDGKEPFRLVGTDQRFGVLGNMDIRRGTIRVRDRPFSIKSGEIDFGSVSRVEPRFDVRADTDVRRNNQLNQENWRIGVHAWGTPESFQFELTSDPYLSEDDIALLLAVGSTHTELAQMAASNLTSTAALEALATVTGVEREVKRALPAIDEVHIASAYSPRTLRTEPQLHLGKRVADRMRVSASTALSQARDFSSGVDYQISDKTSVGARYNNKTTMSYFPVGDVGVDVKWRLEFD